MKQKYIKIYIISGILLFFGILFLLYLAKSGILSEDTKMSKVRNDRVTFEQPKLSIFDETRYINEFPDTIRIHYPYLLVIVPEDTKKITTVYNLEEKKEIASYNDMVLDYYNGNFLYNFHGGSTHFKGKDLKIHCDHGFIKSEREVLCITAKGSDPMDNKLISIEPQTLAAKDLYSSQNALTAVYFDKGTLYIGEYDFAHNKAFITVNNKTAQTTDLVNMFYLINNTMYAASFKSVRNGKIESYSELLITKDKLLPKLAEKGKIVLYL